jgi:hypothetical protein
MKRRGEIARTNCGRWSASNCGFEESRGVSEMVCITFYEGTYVIMNVTSGKANVLRKNRHRLEKLS